ncbi:hypothetical protein [Streptomyces sp. NPDC018347]|uniref:hypothetical protein n=1 Tax=Streptomyces sp. NPDC018347 TaxID=3157193 RepID=UPI00340F3818
MDPHAFALAVIAAVIIELPSPPCFRRVPWERGHGNDSGQRGGGHGGDDAALR